MTKARGKLQNQRGLVDGTIQPEPEEIAPTYADSDVVADVKAHLIPGFGDWEVQIVERTVRLAESGQLVEFAAMIQVRAEGTDDDWVDVERVDCAHGHVHVDQFDSSGKQTKNERVVPEECKTDLDRARVWGSDYIWDIETRMRGWL